MGFINDSLRVDGETATPGVVRETIAGVDTFWSAPIAPHKWAHVHDPNTPIQEFHLGSYPTTTAFRQAFADGKACKAAREAYAEARQAVDAMDVSATRVTSVRRKRRRREEGDDIIIDRALSGDPECWWTRHREPVKRSLTVGFNISKSCTVDHGKFYEAVAATIAVVEHLQSAGYCVRVIAFESGMATLQPDSGADPPGQPMEKECLWLAPFIAKDYNEPVDPQRLLTIGEPGTLRILGFRWTEKVVADQGYVKPGGYGRVGILHDEHLRRLEIDLLADSRIDGTMTGHIRNLTNRLEQIARKKSGAIEAGTYR